MKTYDATQLSTNTTYQLALMLGDTSVEAGAYMFEDEELAYFLTANGSSLNLAAGQACRAASCSASKIAIAATVLGTSWDKKSISDRFLRLAQEFERRDENEPFSVRSVMSDGDNEFEETLTGRSSFNFEDNGSDGE